MRTVRRAFAFLVLVLASCASSGPYVWADQLPPTAAEAYRISIADRLTVVVQGQQQLSGEFEVLPTGGYIQPLVGEIMVNDLALSEAEELLRTKLKGIVVNPVVTISVRTLRTLSINVLGQVRTPGVFQVPYGEGMLTVLARAGGLTEFADPSGIYIIRQIPQIQRVRFRYADLVGAQPQSLAFRLADGDVLVVE
jgi:polysaccharide export outer membrane protein